MATDRIYGKFQWAGVKVATAAKSQVNQSGTDAYAMLVSSGGADTIGGALPINFNNLPQVLGYTGDNLTTVAVTDGTNTWTQTYTYTGDNVTAISGWVKS